MVEVPANRRFRPCDRLRKSGDFKRVYQLRARASDGILLVYAYRNDLGASRLGLSVSRKVGNAVIRNRWKRLLREAFRLQRDRLPKGIDLVVIPKSSPPPDFHEVARALVGVAGRAARRLGDKTKAKPPFPLAEGGCGGEERGVQDG